MSYRRTLMLPGHGGPPVPSGADPAERDALLAQRMQLEEFQSDNDALLAKTLQLDEIRRVRRFRRPTHAPVDSSDADLQRAAQESLEMSLEAPNLSDKVTTDDLERLKQAINFEIRGAQSNFGSTLVEKEPETQIRIIEYLISKDQAALSAAEFKEDSAIETEVEELDDLGLFKEFTTFLSNVLQKAHAKIEAYIPELRKARLTSLQSFEEEIYQKNPGIAVPQHIVDRFRLVELLKGIHSQENAKTKKTKLIANLSAYLASRRDLTRTQVLNIFKELRNRNIDSPLAFIHQQKYAALDWCRLWLKSNTNGSQESFFWHTDTYQDALNLLKRAYEGCVDDVSPERKTEEQYFIDYKRGNAPIHWTETSLRQAIPLKP